MIKLILSTILAILYCAPALAVKTRFVYLGRNYTLVAPTNTSTRNLPLVVLLHGCKQNPALIIDGTNFEEAAEKHKFLILAPEQPGFANADNCWNWFLDLQQRRIMTNEMGQIVSAVELLTKKYSLDANRIFVTGISAGGAFAHNLTVCYPEVFAASAIHSGLAYKTAETLREAQTVLTTHQQKSPDYLGERMYGCSKSASGNKLKKVLIIHGDDDRVVPTLHADLITKSQYVWKDYEDDGKKNNSVRTTSRNEVFHYPNGYSIRQSDTVYAGFTERKLIVEGLQHAWGGGKPLTVHFDPEAPSSTQFILSFFGLLK